MKSLDRKDLKEKKLIGKLVSYKAGSASAKALSERLGIKRIKHEGKPITVQGFLINWGSSKLPERIIMGNNAIILNEPSAIAKASNKLESFKLFKGHVPIPDFTESPHEACRWLYEGKTDVVVRLKLNGHSGDGILIETHDDPARIKDPDLGIAGAPLYTKYIKKEDEYRLHVFKDEVFFVQKKARKLDVPDDKVNWQIRNHQNGFIYANKDIVVPELYKEIAVKAVKALGLHFGAVDLITQKNGKAFVLEVNTACGLEGTTLEKYCEQFRKYLG